MRWSNKNEVFAVVPAPRLRTIKCGCDGSVWGMAGVGAIYRLQDKALGWERVPNSRKIGRIALSRKNAAWGVDLEGRPRKWDETTLSWKRYPGRLRDIQVSCSGARIGVGIGGGLWQWDHASRKWAKIGGGARRLAIGLGRVFVIGRVGHLFRRRLPAVLPASRRERARLFRATSWKVIGRQMRRIAAGADGTVWGVDRKRQIWKISHAHRAELPKLPGRNTVKLGDRNVADHELLQPDGWPADPFRAGSDPGVRPLMRLNRKLSERMYRALVRAPGGVLAQPKVQPPRNPPVIRFAREAKLGDNIKPNDPLPQSELVDFVNLDSE